MELPIINHPDYVAKIKDDNGKLVEVDIVKFKKVVFTESSVKELEKRYA